jgi:hypothetical protein
MATSQTPELIGLAQRTLRDLRLRVAGASGGGPDALREAGYAGAPSLFDAFETWLADRGEPKPEDLPIDEFSQRAGQFFQAAGWGRVTFRSLHDALAVIDIENCWEASDQPADAVSWPATPTCSNMPTIAFLAANDGKRLAPENSSTR